MRRITTYYLFLLMMLCAFSSCGGGEGRKHTPSGDSATTVVPRFNPDSAYYYVSRQVEFGYRVPGTAAHTATARWLSTELERHGAEVIKQQAEVVAYDGTQLPMCNIIARFSPEKSTRIALAAHWDSRPYADKDPDAAYHRQPIDGANDGASGVGVLLEIARCMGEQLPTVGVDILLFDVEDYGAPEWVHGDTSNSWALGSRYWSTHKHTPDYKARYGILLDMVGASGVGFYKEYFSQRYAPHIVDKVWDCATQLGYDWLFINSPGGAITDDHINMNEAGIPTIDIIQQDPSTESGFFAQWHTREDNMQHISPAVLEAVGQVVLTIIYREK